MKTLYIAYGDNLHLEQMRHRCPDAKAVGQHWIEGYCLVFRGRNGSAVATIEPAEGGRVPGLLWEISDQDQLMLDQYKGCPRLYKKELHTVEFRGKPRQAMVYVMNPGPELGRPSGMYYNTVLEGYKVAGFDPGIVKTAARYSWERGLQHV